MFKFSYEKISAFLPRKVVKVTNSLMAQGGFKRISPRAYIGFSLFFSLLIGILSFFAVQFFTLDSLISSIVPIAVFGIVETLFYVLLIATAEARARQIEEALPHALQIISSNIRAGMTLENAIWGSARPEFGSLQEEIQKVSADTFGGVPILVALTRLTDRVRSPLVERAVKLLVQGISLGGEMANLLDEVANDLRTVQKLKQEIITSTTTYAIFIVFAAVIVSPLLFAVSVYYSQLNEDIFQKRVGDMDLDKSPLQLSGFGGAKSTISVEAIRLFALISILITSFSASIILGLIRFGSALRGLFYAPAFLIVSLLLFFLASTALSSALSPVFA